MLFLAVIVGGCASETTDDGAAADESNLTSSRGQAVTAYQGNLDKVANDLHRFATKLAAGELEDDEFVFLVRGEAALLEMDANMIASSNDSTVKSMHDFYRSFAARLKAVNKPSDVTALQAPLEAERRRARTL